MSRRFYNLLRYFLIISIVIASSFVSFGEYPEHEVDVIISFSAGGATDTMARAIFPFVEEKLGVPFVIQNMPGASTLIGTTALAMSEPDGYTIGNLNTMTCVTLDLTMKDATFTLKEDIQPLCQVCFDAGVIVVPKDSPFKTFDDLVSYAKEHPGEVSVGVTALWGGPHIHMLMLERAAGIKLNPVVFPGTADVRAAVLGGHIDAGTGGCSDYAQIVEEGELGALVTSGLTNWAEHPDIPTYFDLGYDIEYGSSRGFGVRKGTPVDTINLLADTIKEVIQEPEFISLAKKIGIYSILSFRGPEAHTEFLYDLQDQMKEFLPEDVLAK